MMRRITWLYVTRSIGIAALIYEVVVQQVDRPSLMIVIGAMILGTEAFSIRKGGGNNGRSNSD